VIAAERQVARLLSLDHNASDYPQVGERDPVIGRLQEERPGSSPRAFPLTV
jgi:DNA-3-methyladenine glycosylase II